MSELLLQFTTQNPVLLVAPRANEGRREKKMEASSALLLHFTTQIPVLLVAPAANKGEREERRAALSALRLHCCTTEISILLAAPVADSGDRGGRREASSALPLHFTTQNPVLLVAPTANEGEREGRREASSALPLHFTTQNPVLLVAPTANEGEREGRRAALSAPRLYCCTTEIRRLHARCWRPWPACCSTPRNSLSCLRRLWPTRRREEEGGRTRRPCRSTSARRSPSCSRRLWPTRGRGEGGGRRAALSELLLHFTTQIPVLLVAPAANEGEREGGGRAASSALLLHFTTQNPSLLVAPMADEGGRERRREALWALLLHFTTQIPVLLVAPTANEGEREERRAALLVPYPLCTEMPSPLLALMASITLKAHMLLLPLVISRPPIAGCIRASRHYISRLFLGSFLFTSLSKREDCSMTPCRVGAGDERDDRGLTDESRITVFALPFSLSQTDRVIGAQVEKSRGSENFSG